MKIYKNIYERIISAENLFSAWEAFKSDKRNRRDVREFERRLEENIFELSHDLLAKSYGHGPYRGLKPRLLAMAERIYFNNFL